MVRRVRVQASLDGARRHFEGLPARGHLDRLEVDAVGGTRADQRFDFGNDLRLEGFLEPLFSAAS